jgi:carboxyl-terminal processing protease
MHRHLRLIRVPAVAGALLFVLCFGAPVFAALDATPDEVLQTEITVKRPGAVEKIVSKFVADLISRHHYSRHALDEEISAAWFNEYFDALDHNRMFFTSADIDEFRSYENTLGEIVQKRGNVDFAYDVYERFLFRVREWAAYSLELLDEPLDFSKDETILIDRHHAPWPADVDELHDLWRRRLKNNLLVEELRDRSAGKDHADSGDAEDQPPQAQQDQADEEPDPAQQPGPVHTAKSPQERVAESYTRYLKRKIEVEPIEILEVFLTSLTRVYDPHSAYMAPETEEDFDISMSLSLQGIGAVLTTKDSYVEIVSIIPGGPAERDGRLKEGDRIIAVAQEQEEPVDVVDMRLRKVVNMIRGPKGTRVLLTVLESGSSSPTVIDIERDEVKLTEQEAKSEVRTIELPEKNTAPGGADRNASVAVISLPSFYADFAAKHRGEKDYKSSTRDVARLIDQANEKHVDGIILDLRSNGGGSLDEAIDLAGLFIETGPVVQVRKSDGEIEKRYDTDDRVAYGGPLIVMVDKLSASASEIVAAALQDYGRAVIVGEQSTHGKGTVQTVYHLDRRLGGMRLFRDKKAGSLKFTMAKFYRVNGGSTQVKGVTPDIVFPSFTDAMELGEAELPHVLPWDEIEPLETNCDVDVKPVLDDLAKRSAARLAAEPEYQQHVKDVKDFAERRDRKTLSLNRKEREEYQQEEEKWAKKMRELQARRRRRGEEDEKKDEQTDDWMLEETLCIMADMLTLQQAAATDSDAVPQLAGPKAGEAIETVAP